jgi:hypothetical protein
VLPQKITKAIGSPKPVFFISGSPASLVEARRA